MPPPDQDLPRCDPRDDVPRLEDPFEAYRRSQQADLPMSRPEPMPGQDKWAGMSVQDWQNRAMLAAGIDPANWDPSDGFEDNKENIEKVYALYAKWYLQDTSLKWAGMAKLAGGTVYGGLLHLVDERPPVFSIWNLVTPVLAYRGAKRHQMDKVERIFVGMQKNIFMDLAWQHQAYVEGGLPALKAAYDRGDLSGANYQAWTQIASGNEKAVWEGNRALLLREQSQVLPPDYERIQDLLGGGKITSQISAETVSPIPGGDAFQKLYPDGDVTDFKDRWKWIDEHMLPEYKALGGEYTRILVQQPLDELARQEFAPNPNRPR
jgi:uncharacterized protein DUF2515